MKKLTKKTIQVFISIGLLLLLLRWIDVDQLKTSIANANFLYLGIAFVLITCNRILMPVKWNLLLRANHVYVSWFDIIRIYYISTFLGLYLPPTVGSDIVRMYYISRTKYHFSDILSSIVVERLLGFIALIIFGILGCSIFFFFFSDVTLDLLTLFFMVIILMIIVAGGFLFSLTEAFDRFVSSCLEIMKHKKGIGKLAAKFHSFFSSYVHYKNKKLILLFFLALTCVEVTLPIIRSYIIALALGATIPLIYFFAFMPIILLLIRLPISIDGFGINEGGFVYFLSLIGVSATLAFSIGIINHFIFLIGVLPGGIFYGFNKDLREYRIDQCVLASEKHV